MKEQPKRPRTLSNIMNFIFLTFLHGSYVYVIVTALIDAGGGSYADIFSFRFGFMGMVAAILLLFSPVVFYIVEVLSIFRGEGDHAGKLFIGAEMPTFLFSLLFIASFYTVPAAVYLYVVALCAIAFYTMQIISKERALRLPVWLANSLSLLGAGVFTYVGLLWLVFVPFLVYLPVLLLSAIQSLSYSFDLVSILGVFLVGVFIYGVYFIPFYGIFSYWKQLEDRALPAPSGIPKKFQGIIWKVIAGLGKKASLLS